ncbi:MAG: leucine-rich repeat domain-containing protein [Treponema sp.]|nr:leucine-rich repeat domain-containing protein [Treponema sp.]
MSKENNRQFLFSMILVFALLLTVFAYFCGGDILKMHWIKVLASVGIVAVIFIGLYFLFVFIPNSEKPSDCIKIWDKESQFIEIDSSISVIPDCFFKNFSNLEKIVFDGKVKCLGKNAFQNCNNLSEIIFLDRVEFYDRDVFKSLKNLKRISFYELDCVADESFYGCNNLGFFEIKNGKTIIGEKAFVNCKKLNDVILPYSIIRICNAAFENCENFQAILICKDENFVWLSKDELGTVGICPSIRFSELGYDSFFGNRKIEKFKIPHGISTLQPWCFGFCENLKNVEIPYSVKKIASHSFSGCKNLSKIYFEGTEQEFKKIYPTYRDELSLNCIIKTTDNPNGKLVWSIK